MPDRPLAPSGNPAATREVVAMFDRIAPVYDLMNSVMSAGIDARWRRAALAAARLGPAMRVLDVACGTGVLTRMAANAIAPGGTALGIDLSERMLKRASRARSTSGVAIEYRLGDALALPVEDAGFDAVLIGFGLRNLPDYAAGLREMARAARPGGRIVVLEIAVPRASLPRIAFRTWFERVVPVVGRLIGGGNAYRYLPLSLDTYPEPEQVAGLMREIGLTNVRWRWLTSAMATLHVGLRAPE
jgi:demethylmenaquinone methyltransferase / 2-methoxy-6-polyprenyl-1,4-benzoquinol methylase